MSDREAHRFDHLSDGHLADKAAYGDSGAFVALADRFHDQVWTVAALAAADEGTATQATARAFTRTLAGLAAGISDPDACVERALVAAAFELAVTARIETEDLAGRLPDAVLAEDPATRVALWLTTTRGWTEADALAAVTTDEDSASSLAAAPAVEAALADLDLHAPEGLGAATADAWREWQGIGLTIPERHPLTAVLARLDAPLGRMGDALGRAGSRTTRRRRARTTTPSVPATPPAPTLLPLGAEGVDDRTSVVSPTEPEPFGLRIAAAATAAASTPRPAEATTPDPPVPAPSPAPTVDEVEPVAATPAATPPSPAPRRSPAPRTVAFDPHAEGLDLPVRRGGPGARHVVTAGATPTRTRVLAALAAGILTASAMGSLLSATPTDGGGTGADEVAAVSPAAAGGEGVGDLLDDLSAVPAANVSDSDEADADADPLDDAPTADASGSTGAGSTSRDAARPPSSPDGGGSDGGAPAAGGGPSTGGGAPAASGGSPGAGGGTGGASPTPAPAPAPVPSPAPAPAPTAPPTTAPAPPPTTTPPTTTTPPATTEPAGPVCTVLPILCPGGGLIP